MADKRDVQLRVSAVDVNSKKTFKEVAASIDNVTTSLVDQLAAAKRGEGGTAGLVKAMADLKKAQADLIQQQGVVDLYRSLEQQQERAAQAVRDTTQAASAQRAVLEGIEKPTRVQVRELKALETAERNALKSLMGTTRGLAEQEDTLRTLGLRYDDIEAAQRQLGQAAVQVGTFYRATENALESYSSTVAQVGEAQRKLAAEKAFTAQLEGARELRQSADYVKFWTDAIEQMTLKEREAAEVSARLAATQQREASAVAGFRETAAKNAELERRARYELDIVAALQKQEQQERQMASLDAFRQKGLQAEAAATKISTVGSASAAATAPTNTLAAAIRGVLNPSGEAIRTLDGLENVLREVTSAIGDGKAPIREYQGAINELAAAQTSIVRTADMIDGFRQQEAAVARAETAFNEARVSVSTYAAEVASADAPNEELAASLQRAERALEATNTDLAAQRARLEALRGPLKAAVGDTNDLAAAERRLKDASQAAAVAGGKLKDAESGRNSRAGSFLGLKPYELQNLSYQINDVFTQLASGTSITQTLAQQGGQIGQLFPRMFAVFLNPAVAAGIVAVTGALVPLGFALFKLRSDSESLKIFTAQLRASADGGKYQAAELVKAADTLNKYRGNLEEARASVKTFASENINVKFFEDFGIAARNFATVTGKEIPEASEDVAKAFTGTYDEVKALDKEFNFLTETERKHIRTMFESGKEQEARREAFEIFYAKMADGSGVLERQDGIVKNLSRAWGGFMESLSRSDLIRNTAEEVAFLTRNLQRLINLLPGARGQAATVDLQVERARNSNRLRELDRQPAASQGALANTPLGRMVAGQVRSGARAPGQTEADRLRARDFVLGAEIARRQNEERVARGPIVNDTAEDEKKTRADYAEDNAKKPKAGRTGKTDEERAAERRQAFLDSLDAENAARAFSITLLDKTALEAEVLSEIERARLRAIAAGTELTKEQADAIRASVTAAETAKAEQEASELVDKTRLELARARNEIEERSVYIARKVKEEGIDASSKSYVAYTTMLGQLYDIEAATRRRADAEKAVNDQVAYRQLLMEQIEFYENSGDQTKANGLREQLVGVNAELLKAIDGMIALTTAAGGPGMDAALLKLTQLRDGIVNAGQKTVATGQQINQSIAQGATQAFSNFWDAVGQGEDVFDSARDAFLNFAADFLQQIAMMILQQAILNALGGGQSGGGGAGGGIAGFINGLFNHEGGTVGNAPTNMRRKISPAAFIGAPRYHNGTVVGLRPDEQASILQKGEEVLKKSDPRNIMNGGAAAPGAAAPSGYGPASPLTVINALNSSELISEALGTKDGSEAQINFIGKNKRRIREALGV